MAQSILSLFFMLTSLLLDKFSCILRSTAQDICLIIQISSARLALKTETNKLVGYKIINIFLTSKAVMVTKTKAR